MQTGEEQSGWTHGDKWALVLFCAGGLHCFLALWIHVNRHANGTDGRFKGDNASGAIANSVEAIQTTFQVSIRPADWFLGAFLMLVVGQLQRVVRLLYTTRLQNHAEHVREVTLLQPAPQPAAPPVARPPPVRH